MTRFIAPLAGALLAITTVSGAALAQGTAPVVNPAPLMPRTIEPTATEPMKVVPVVADPLKVDLLLLKGGHRASDLIGSAVLSEAGDKVGTIDDLIILKNQPAPYAVMAVGGMFGFGARYVVVSADALVIGAADIRLTGSNKDTLGMLPDFQYSN